MIQIKQLPEQANIVQININLSLAEDATEPQGGNPPDFPLLLRLPEWATLSVVPFSKLRKGLSELKLLRSSYTGGTRFS